MDKKFVIFGDSIAYGAWDPRGGGWVGRLRKYFELKGSDDQFYNFSVCGFTTEDLIKVTKFECGIKKFDLAIVAIGINDSRFIGNRNNTDVDLNRFSKNIKIIHGILKKKIKKIFFVGLTRVNEKKTNPIRYSKVYFYNNERVKEYNEVIDLYCQKGQLGFIDVWSKFKSEYLDSDGLHINELGHKYIFNRVKKYLLKK